MAPLELVTNLATRCHHLYWFQIWPLDDFLQIWPPDGTTCITNKFAHQTKSHALPDCLGLPYWHYQLVLTWYLHQPESHQLSLQNLSESVSDNRTHRSDQGYLGPIKIVKIDRNAEHLQFIMEMALILLKRRGGKLSFYVFYIKVTWSSARSVRFSEPTSDKNSQTGHRMIF